ncbi:MAG: helix-hairpin-helix domain-containing protein [Lachnospiraceae bacterium]
MKYRRIKATAILVLFLTAGVLYSADRSQDIFVYDDGLSVGEETADRQEAGADSGSDCSGEDAAGKKNGDESAAGEAAATLPGTEPVSGEETASQSESEVLVHVHVCGAVKKAGVYLLPENSIVADAIEEAGGVLKGGAADYLNLAGTISEGDKIYVPYLKDVKEPCGVALQPSSGSEAQSGQGEESSSKTDALVNINTADSAQLMTLSGIGQTRADAIIAYREANGNFQKIEDIMKVSGIKEGAFNKIKDRITV